jgi:hypothetical protein
MVTDDRYGEILWLHALAVGYSPLYLSENADGIRSNWPRIPLPVSQELLQASAELGDRIAALVDPDGVVEGVTSSVSDPHKSLGVVERLGGGTLQAKDLVVEAGWGFVSRTGTMPGNGTVAIRFCSDSEKAHIGQSNLSILGDECLDVALNESVYWQCVPMPVWNYRIGGHQVLKKWLSYRDVKVLGRPLTSEEVRQFREMVRRLAAIVLMGPALDSNYETTRDSSHPWSQT